MMFASRSLPFMRRRRPLLFLLVLLGLSGLSGCDMDSYADPSITGRWENTPVVLPILDRLDVVEEPEDAIPGLSQISSEDLIPEVSEYVLGPNDVISVTVFELIQPNLETVQIRQIDELGYIRLPVIGQVKAGGLTARQLERQISDILDPDVLQDPTVTVTIQQAQQRTFNIVGAVGGVGTYSLLKSDFRVMDAIALARGIPSDTETIYVIRQVPLNEIVERGTLAPAPVPAQGDTPQTNGSGSDAAPSNGETEKPFDPASLIEELTDQMDKGERGTPTPPAPTDATLLYNDAGDAAKGNGVAAPLAEALEAPAKKRGRWVNIDGKWVQVEAGAQAGTEPGVESSQLPPSEQLVTQRVIEIDAQELIKGDARYNIVIRPDDIVRVPAPLTGNFYIGGSISRPGTYAIPGERKLTLKQAVIAAGGLNAVGIPERVDLIRRIDKNTEATVRLNLRAIFEGVQPDIYLKPDDTINVGTSPVATFLAVVRNGFRTSYGFGFLLDRNFDDSVFGYQRVR